MESSDTGSITSLFETSAEQIVSLVSTYVPNLLGALLILVVGWLIAIVVASLVANLLKKTKLTNLIADSIEGSSSKEAEKMVAKRSKSVVYWLVMIFVLIAFFQALNLTLITTPLNSMLDRIFQFAPQLIAAAAILLVGWFVAQLVKKLLTAFLTGINLDEKLASKSGKASSELKVSESIANTVYWLILLLILPLVLNTLELNGILQPVNAMFSELLSHLPNIFSAVLILVIGWFLANIVKEIVSNLLASAGVDGFAESMGISKALGDKTKLSGIIGTVVYVFILFPVLIQSLDSLKLEAIVGPATNILNQIFGIIPSVFAALITLGIAAFVGRLASNLVENLLQSVGFDRVLTWVGLENKVSESNSPSKVVGKLTFIAIILFAAMEAFRIINLEAISFLLNKFIVFAGQILLGIVILFIGLMIANLAANAVKSTGTPQANLLATIAKVAIMVLAVAMGLQEMGFATEIINLAFGLFFGAIAVAIALAFGLGCKDIANEQIKKLLKDLK